MIRTQPRPTLFPYTTLFRSSQQRPPGAGQNQVWRNDHKRQDDSDQALRQRPQAQGETEDVPEPVGAGLRFFALPQKKAKERRSEEHTSELQSLRHLVCRLLL